MGSKAALENLRQEFSKCDLKNGFIEGTININAVESNLRILVFEADRSVINKEDLVDVVPGLLLCLSSSDKNLRQPLSRFINSLKELIKSIEYNQDDWNSVISMDFLQLCSSRLICIVEEFSEDWIDPWLLIVTISFIDADSGVCSAKLNYLLSVIEKSFKIAKVKKDSVKTTFQVWEKFINIITESLSFSKLVNSAKLLNLLAVPLVGIKLPTADPYKYKTWYYVVEKIGLHSATATEKIVHPFLNFLIEHRRIFAKYHLEIGGYLKTMSENIYVASMLCSEILKCIEMAVVFNCQHDDIIAAWTSLCGHITNSEMGPEYFKKMLHFLKNRTDSPEEKDLLIKLCFIAYEHKLFDFKSIFFEDVKSTIEEVFPLTMSSLMFREKVFLKILTEMVEIVDSFLQKINEEDESCMDPILSMCETMLYVYSDFLDTFLNSGFSPTEVDVKIICDLLILSLSQPITEPPLDEELIAKKLRCFLQCLAQKINTDLFSNEFLNRLDNEIKLSRINLNNCLWLASFVSSLDSDVNLIPLLGILSKCVTGCSQPKLILEFLRILDVTTEKGGLKINFKPTLNYLRKFSSSYEPPYDVQIRQLAHTLLKRVESVESKPSIVSSTEVDEKKSKVRSPLTVHSNFLSRLCKAEEKKNKTILASSLFPRNDLEKTDLNKENKQGLDEEESPIIKFVKTTENINLSPVSDRFAKSNAFVLDTSESSESVHTGDVIEPKVASFKVSTDFHHKPVTPTKLLAPKGMIAGLSPKCDQVNKGQEKSTIESSPKSLKSPQPDKLINTSVKLSPSTPQSSTNNKYSFLDNNSLDTQDFVFVPPKMKANQSPLTKHQKEVLSKRREEIPALYQDLSQDTQNTSELSSQENSTFSAPVESGQENISAPKSNENNGDILNNEENAVFDHFKDKEDEAVTNIDNTDTDIKEDNMKTRGSLSPRRLNFEGICCSKSETPKQAVEVHSSKDDSQKKTPQKGIPSRQFARKSTSRFRKSPMNNGVKRNSGENLEHSSSKSSEIKSEESTEITSNKANEVRSDKTSDICSIETSDILLKTPKDDGDNAKNSVFEANSDNVDSGSKKRKVGRPQKQTIGNSVVSSQDKSKNKSPLVKRRTRRSVAASQPNKEEPIPVESTIISVVSNEPVGSSSDIRFTLKIYSTPDKSNEKLKQNVINSEVKEESLIDISIREKPENISIPVISEKSNEEVNDVPKTPPSADKPNRRKRSKKSIQFNEFSPKMLRRGKVSIKSSPNSVKKSVKSMDFSDDSPSRLVQLNKNVDSCVNDIKETDKNLKDVINEGKTSVESINVDTVSISVTENDIPVDDTSGRNKKSLVMTSSHSEGISSVKSVTLKTSPNRSMKILQLANAEESLRDSKKVELISLINKDTKSEIVKVELEDISQLALKNKVNTSPSRASLMLKLVENKSNELIDNKDDIKSVMVSGKNMTISQNDPDSTLKSSDIIDDSLMQEIIPPSVVKGKRKSFGGKSPVDEKKPKLEIINTIQDVSKAKVSSLDRWLIKKEKPVSAESSSTFAVQDSESISAECTAEDALTTKMNEASEDYHKTEVTSEEDIKVTETPSVIANLQSPIKSNLPGFEHQATTEESAGDSDTNCTSRWPKRSRKENKPDDFIYLNSGRRPRNDIKITPTKRKPNQTKQVDLSPSKKYSFINWPKGDCEVWKACEPSPEAVPASFILKRKNNSPGKTQLSPNVTPKKRVSFLDPVVSKGLLYGFSDDQFIGEVQHAVNESGKKKFRTKRKPDGESKLSKEEIVNIVGDLKLNDNDITIMESTCDKNHDLSSKDCENISSQPKLLNQDQNSVRSQKNTDDIGESPMETNESDELSLKSVIVESCNHKINSDENMRDTIVDNDASDNDLNLAPANEMDEPFNADANSSEESVDIVEKVVGKVSTDSLVVVEPVETIDTSSDKSLLNDDLDDFSMIVESISPVESTAGDDDDDDNVVTICNNNSSTEEQQSVMNHEESADTMKSDMIDNVADKFVDNINGVEIKKENDQFIDNIEASEDSSSVNKKTDKCHFIDNTDSIENKSSAITPLNNTSHVDDISSHSDQSNGRNCEILTTEYLSDKVVCEAPIAKEYKQTCNSTKSTENVQILEVNSVEKIVIKQEPESENSPSSQVVLVDNSFMKLKPIHFLSESLSNNSCDKRQQDLSLPMHTFETSGSSSVLPQNQESSDEAIFKECERISNIIESIEVQPPSHKALRKLHSVFLSGVQKIFSVCNNQD